MRFSGTSAAPSAMHLATSARERSTVPWRVVRVPASGRRPPVTSCATASKPEPGRPVSPTTSPGATSKASGPSPSARSPSTRAATSVAPGLPFRAAHRLHGLAEHVPGQVLLADPCGGQATGCDGPVAQDRHPVGELQHLGEVVAHHEHRRAVGHDRAQQPVEALQLLAREGPGGLVEDDESLARVLVAQGPGDGHLGTAHGAQARDGGARVDGDVEPLEDPPGDGVLGLPVDLAGDAVVGEAADPDVLRHRQLVEQAEVLVHDRDPGRRRLAPPDGQVEDLPVHGERGTGIRLVVPREDLHEGGLAGPVLADEGVDLPGRDREVDLTEHRGRAERLGDVAGLQPHRRGHGYLTPQAVRNFCSYSSPPNQSAVR